MERNDNKRGKALQAFPGGRDRKAGPHFPCRPDCPHERAGILPAAEILRLQAGDLYRGTAEGGCLLAALRGEASCTYGRSGETPVAPGGMAFLPAGCKYAVRAARQTALLLLRPEEPLRLCDCLRLEDLDAPDPHTPRPDALRLGPDSRRVLRTLAGAMDAGCACRCLALAAIRELLVLLRWEYRPEQLAAFFGPAAGQDAAFAAFVLRNALLYHTAGDLAQAMNYSLSGFEKRFRRVFGTSPYRWMLRKKADAVYHELLAGTLDFDRIADLYGFASQQHFSAFVAGMLGGTPSAIRHAGGKWREFIKDG